MRKKRIQCVTMSDGCCLLRLSSFPEIQGDKHTSVHANSKCWNQDPTPDQPTTEDLVEEDLGRSVSPSLHCLTAIIFY